MTMTAIIFWTMLLVPGFAVARRLVPDELEGANLTQGTARVAVSSANDARYVRWCLRSAPSGAFWDAAVGGATFRALNLAPLAEHAG